MTRASAGFYRLTFRRDIRFVNGNVQAGGPVRDAASMIFTSRYDMMNARPSRMSIVIVRP